uniref:Uncharacterized protein n=1 Tax=Anguilla anguilla TaxID=7936 RepID=A0A0E9T750_ANGAN
MLFRKNIHLLLLRAENEEKLVIYGYPKVSCSSRALSKIPCST